MKGKLFRSTRNRLLGVTLVGAAATATIVSCGDDEDAQSAKDKLTTFANSEANSLATAYPGGLAISVFPVESSGAALVQDASQPKTIAEKKAEAEALVAGTAADCVPPVLKQEHSGMSPETCYEFDQDMLASGLVENGSFTSITTGTTNGQNSGGEACLVAFARSEMDEVVAMVDQATAMVQSLLCQATKDGQGSSLPASGGSINLASSMNKVASGMGGTVSKAEISRLSDIASRPVFRIDIEMSDSAGNAREVHLVHSPQADGSNSEYNGTLWLRDATSAHGLVQTPNDSEHLMSITYAQKLEAGQEILSYELRQAQMTAHIAEVAFGDDGVLNLNANTNANLDYLKADGTAYTQANEAAGNFRFVAFKSNPATDEVTFSYWKNPGASVSENPRGMVLTSSLNSSGQLEGCGTSGAAFNGGVSGGSAESIRKGMVAGTHLAMAPQGFLHPMLNRNGDSYATGTDSNGSYHQVNNPSPQGAQTIRWYPADVSDSAGFQNFWIEQSGPMITRQCFKQNATSGKYEIDSAVITENAGYELVKTDDANSANKLIAPPDMTHVKPLDGNIKGN